MMFAKVVYVYYINAVLKGHSFLWAPSLYAYICIYARSLKNKKAKEWIGRSINHVHDCAQAPASVCLRSSRRDHLHLPRGGWTPAVITCTEKDAKSSTDNVFFKDEKKNFTLIFML